MKRSVAEIHQINPDQIDGSRTYCGIGIPPHPTGHPLGSACAGFSAASGDELRAKYGVGVSPLREALTRLASERLVTSVGQRGFRVAPLTAFDVEDTMATRIVIESEALTRSIKFGDMAWETALVAAFHALSRNPIRRALVRRPKFGPFITASSIWRCYAHPVRAGSWNWPACCSIRRKDNAISRSKFGSQKILKRDTVREHQQIFDAALARDTKAAVRALERHYLATAEQVVSVLSRIPKVAAKQA